MTRRLTGQRHTRLVALVATASLVYCCCRADSFLTVMSRASTLTASVISSGMPTLRMRAPPRKRPETVHLKFVL